ncbi:leucine-rich repeat domain-containing protein [Patescibacteria group bacterium]|nr:leucine-rich repeat domain-containing protein [Patescibacteria group bacterium]
MFLPANAWKINKIRRTTKTSRIAQMKNGLGLALLRTRIGRAWWLPVFCLLATAVTVKADDFIYTINSNGTITITGYTGSDSVVIVPATIDGMTVSSIGDLIFDNCTNLTTITVNGGNSVYSSVDGVLFNKNQTTLIQYPTGKAGNYTVPNNVTTIGNKAFYNCTSLTNVTIPSSVTTIGNDAFDNCTSLVGVTIPSGVTTIGDYAFDNCTNLNTITVDAGNSTYCSVSGVLFNKNQTILIKYPAGKTGSYTVPYNVTAIADRAFQFCINLTGVTIHSSVTTIGKDAFDNCTRLAGVTVPASVISIGDYAFDNCTCLTAITVDSGNSAYYSASGVLFNKNQTTLIQYPAGKSGTYTIPSSVTAIGDRAFQFCTNLTGVTIPSGIITIGDYAFDRCTSLTGVTIPSSVSNIGDYAFDNCTSLATFTVDSGNSAYYSVSGVLFNNSQTTLIQYPAGKSGIYTIPSSVTAIGDRAFQFCTNLTGVTIPYSVTAIGNYAFDKCTSLTGVTIPYSVTSIGNYAFYRCTSLAAITMDTGNSTYSSMDGVLFNKNQTTLIQYPAGKSGTYTIPSSVTAIGDRAFQFCTNLTGVTIPYSVTAIGNYAFDKCTSLTGVTIPASVTSIGNLAFDHCTSLAAITVDAGNSAYSSVDGVLFNKNQITLIQYPAGKSGTYTIPNNVTGIGNSAFDNCIRLAGITIPSSTTTIGNSVFNNCTSLTSVTIPDSVSSIGDWAFRSCSSLISVTLGTGISTIGDYAFSLCAGLTGIYFEGNAPGIGSSVFEADNNATVYYLPGTTGWGQTFGGRPTAQWNNTIGPTIKANGTDREVIINYPATLSITVSINAGDYTGLPVDWWIVAQAGSDWYYLNNSFQWTQFDGNLSNCHPVHQGALFNLPATEVSNIYGLPIDLYTLWFAVDYPMDGILNLNGLILLNSVNVTVQ